MEVMRSLTKSRTVLGICLLVAALTLAVYGQTLWYDFVNYDDPGDVMANPIVNQGLTLTGIGAAFTTSQDCNWVPLTMLSHQLDCQFYGLKAGGHHLTSVLLHLASAILLFLALRQMSGATWRSAFVAAVFAVHPLHVESVAWVAERKDVLSGLFFMLTLWTYVRYTRHLESPAAHLTVVLMFLFGLMSKSMLVTLPFVLLLLDYWPLGRFSSVPAAAEPGTAAGLETPWTPTRLLIEKIPLLLLAFLFSMLTVWDQTKTIVALRTLPLSNRLENSLISMVSYLWQMFCPTRLAIFYPYQDHDLPPWKVTGSAVLLGAITLYAFFQRKKRPYLLVGWLWYLGMLIPVIGIVQVGAQSKADRYTYLPQIGLYVMIAWLAADLLLQNPVYSIFVVEQQRCAHSQ